MKKLLIAFLLLAGCTERSASKNKEYPEYALDQDVRVVSGFYRGKMGKITGWIPCTDRDTHEQTVCYSIKTETDTYQVNQKDVRP